MNFPTFHTQLASYAVLATGTDMKIDIGRQSIVWLQFDFTAYRDSRGTQFNCCQYPIRVDGVHRTLKYEELESEMEAVGQAIAVMMGNTLRYKGMVGTQGLYGAGVV